MISIRITVISMRIRYMFLSLMCGVILFLASFYALQIQKGNRVYLPIGKGYVLGAYTEVTTSPLTSATPYITQRPDPWNDTTLPTSYNNTSSVVNKNIPIYIKPSNTPIYTYVPIPTPKPIVIQYPTTTITPLSDTIIHCNGSGYDYGNITLNDCQLKIEDKRINELNAIAKDSEAKNQSRIQACYNDCVNSNIGLIELQAKYNDKNLTDDEYNTQKTILEKNINICKSSCN